jgi:predicted DNA-binding protein (MmcQ/YjbR family)
MPRKNAANDADAALKELRAFGLAYPGAHTKSPWPGHMDLAVNDKTFAYLSVEGEPFSISCKLPHSSTTALMLRFTEPTAYGLGKSGWVSARFAAGEEPPVSMLKEWIDESYRAQAPKRLLAQLDATTSTAPTPAPAPKKKKPRATGT